MIYKGQIPSQDCLIDVCDKNITLSTTAAIFWGVYESAEIRFIRRYLRRDLDVIELGSSIGVVSSHIAKILEPNRKMICVEANPNLFEALHRNISINAGNRDVTIINAAIDYSGQLEVPLFLSDNNISSHLEFSTSDRAVPIQSTTLNKILQQHQLSESFVLVMDIEGSESGIIFQDKEGLNRARQIIVELHATEYQNIKISIDNLCKSLQNNHQYALRANYGPIYVFEK